MNAPSVTTGKKDVSIARQNAIKLFELEKSLILLENLFQNTTDAMAILDHHLNLKKINLPFIEAFAIIFSIKITEGMNLYHLLSDFPDIQKNIVDACNNASAGEARAIILENDTDNAETYYYYEIIIVKKIFDNTSQPTNGLTILIHNKTAYQTHQKNLTKLQIALNSATRLHTIGEMAAALAHEINQPLAAINIYSHSCLEYANKGLQQHDKLVKGLEQIALLSEHAGETLHHMKNFIRQGELTTEKISLNRIIQQAVNYLDYQKNELKFSIKLCLDEKIPELNLDKIKIIQVILNLIQNSIEAMAQDKKHLLVIRIISQKEEDHIKVIFRDNGPGIPEILADKILKSYFTTKPHGTGLGLPICKTLIEAHGGKLIIHYGEPEGAFIYFTLPLDSISCSKSTHEA